MKKLRVALLMAAMFYTSIISAQVEIDGITYTIGKSSATVVKKEQGKYKGDIVIPKEVTYKDKTVEVTRIESDAFWNCDSLTSVSVPESVSTIGDFAFAACEQLTSVNIPEKVKRIYSKTFSGCEKLSSIQLPNGIISIGEHAFQGCKSLSSIVLPESLKEIGNSAFEDCSNIDVLTIPASVTSIGERAFLCCTNLKSIQVAEGNPKYDSRDNCNAIINTESNTLITGCSTTEIPQDVVSIGSNAFRELALTNLVFSEGVKTIEERAFWACKFSKTLIIPHNVERIAEGAFVQCAIDSIIIHGQITKLEMNTFEYCQTLTYIDLPNSLKYIDDYPFQGCYSLQKIISRAPNPPRCSYYAFDYTADTIILEVPEESVSLYKEANVWENFYCIKSESTEGIIEHPDSNRNIVKKGLATYYTNENGECTFLYSYNNKNDYTKIDSTHFAEWNHCRALVINVDTIGSNAFSNCHFNYGQIIYLTSRVKTILEDAFSYMHIHDIHTTHYPRLFHGVIIVFEGETPPDISKGNIMNYDDPRQQIRFSVPDIAAYMESDIQWAYTDIIKTNDLIAYLDEFYGYDNPFITPDYIPTIYINDSTEMEVDTPTDNEENGSIDLIVNARPRKDIPVRIGDGENKDIYSRAPAWMRYTVELKITDNKGTVLYTDSKQCSAYEECEFEATFARPANGIIRVYSRSIDQYGKTSEWTVETLNLDTSIDTLVLPADNTYYDLQGRRVAYPTRGIYIKNGHKVIVE